MQKYFVFILAFLFMRFGVAQTDVYKFSHITDTDGLSQNFVVAIHQDKLGQIWIGTRKGLLKLSNKQNGNYQFDSVRNTATRVLIFGEINIKQDNTG